MAYTKQSTQPVDDRTLHLFVGQKYHWSNLLPHQTYSVAYELVKARKIIKQQKEEIEALYKFYHANKHNSTVLLPGLLADGGDRDL